MATAPTAPGGGTPSSTRSTCARSPTRTATASAICRASSTTSPHLQSLGVDAVWLCPCFPSPQHDHGYDVADYFDIEPTYGDLAMFDRLVAAARDARHPRDARRGAQPLQQPARLVPGGAGGAGRGSPERARFWFRDGKGEHGELPPNNWTRGVRWAGMDPRRPSPTARPASGTCTCSPRGSPTSTGRTTTSQRALRRRPALLVRPWRRRVPRRCGRRGRQGRRACPTQPSSPDGARPPTGRRTTRTSQFRPTAHDHWRRWRHAGRRVRGASTRVADLVTVSEAYTPGRPDLLLKYVEPDQFHQSFYFDLMLAPWIAAVIRPSVGRACTTCSPTPERRSRGR